MSRWLGLYKIYCGERLVGTERFKVHFLPEGCEVRCRIARTEQERRWDHKIQARVSRDWQVLALRFENMSREGSKICSADYRWEGDAWFGRIRTFQDESHDVSWPMSGRVQPAFRAAVFDAFLINHLALGLYASKRVELLEIQEDSLQMVQTHGIWDHLEGSTRKTSLGEMEADCYRRVDPCRGVSWIWVGPRGFVVEASWEDGCAWRLVEFSKEGG